MSEKSLLEFVKALDQLNGANLMNLTGRDASFYHIDEKYKKELKQVMDLINSFDFIKNTHKLCKDLLTKPIPIK